MLPLTVPIMNGPLIPSLSLSLSDDNNIMNTIENYRLILHFDINETILIGDDAGGDTVDDCLNKIIAKSAFVQIPESIIDIQYSCSTINLQPTHWWDGTPIILSSSSDSSIINDDNTNKNEYEKQNVYPPLYTDWIWPMNTCPYYRTMLKDINPKPFIVNDGLVYKPLYDKIQKLMEPQFDMSNNNDYPTSITNIIPSFFHTLMILFPSESSNSIDNIENDASTTTKTTFPEDATNHHYLTKYPISIVLRTMGSDLQNIASIITLFAQGKHPNYPYYKNSKLILDNTNLMKGRWNKKINSNNPTTTTTTTTTTETETKTKTEQSGDTIDNNNDNNNDQYVWQLVNSSNNDNDTDSIIAKNDTEVLNFIHSQSICGIQDDYMFWKQNNFQPWSGKPIWIEKKNNTTTTSTSSTNINHHILLDDNIHNLLDYSIAGIRKETDNNDGSFVFLNNSNIVDQHGIHLIRVPTIEPILNPNWFIEQIEAAHMNFIGTKK